jgi:site-specific DNA recombinase
MTRALIAARLSRKQANGDEGIGLDTQDSRSRAFVERMDWELAGVARDTISGTRAPVDRKDLGRWLNGRREQFDVIVAYKTDRLSRGEDTDWSRIETWAADHGKTLVIVDAGDGIRYPARNESDYWQWTATKRQAGQELASIKERVARAHAAIRENGGLLGRPPWGYESCGAKYSRQMRPTPEGRTYIPETFARALNGDTLLSICQWLDGCGTEAPTGGKWSPKTVSQILRCSTYCGYRRDAAGNIVLRCEALVSAEDFERAGNALAARFHRGPMTNQPALLSGVLHCGRCRGPMYRIKAGRAGQKPRHYYRCAGRGRQRKGCGIMIDLALLDALAVETLEMSTQPWGTRVWVPGTSRRAEIKLEIRALDIDAPDYAERHAALMAELADAPLDSAGHWEECSDGTTIGTHFTALDEAGRVQFLREKNVAVYTGRDAVTEGGPVVPWVIIATSLLNPGDGGWYRPGGGNVGFGKVALAS